MGRRANKATTVQEPAQLEQLLDIPDVMKMLKVSRRIVYRMIREEGLPTVTFGERRLVVPSSLAAWVKQREQSGI